MTPSWTSDRRPNPGTSSIGRQLRIAMVGAKGIPALHGGIERHVDEIAQRLVTRGHLVEVFTRPYHPFRQPYYNGVRLRRRPSLQTKHLDAATHTALCILEAIMTHRYDILHVHGIGPGLFVGWAARHVKTVFTYHAQDWRQKKWGRTARWSLLQGERTAIHSAHAVVAVSHALEHYIQTRYGRTVHYIPNGASVAMTHGRTVLQRWELEPSRYILFVGRLIADRGIDTLIEAYGRVAGEHRLVIVGDVQLDPAHYDALRQRADPRVVFTGYQPMDVLSQLYSNASFCVHPSEVEGLPIAVLEAMGHGRSVLVSDIPENLEAIGPAGESFKVGDPLDLQNALERLLVQPGRTEELGRLARERIQSQYNWDLITAEIERLYLEVAD